MLECNKCKQFLPEENFYPTNQGKRGYHYSCKACSKKRAKDTYHNRREPKYTRTKTTPKDKTPSLYILFNKDDEIIYIGLSRSLEYRLNQHLRESPFSEEIDYIETASFESEIDMAVYELLLINHFDPPYNKHVYKGESSLNVELPLSSFKAWPLR